MASHRFAERCRALLPANTPPAPAERLQLAMELTPLKSAPLRRPARAGAVSRPALVGRAFDRRAAGPESARRARIHAAPPANGGLGNGSVHLLGQIENRIGLEPESIRAGNRSRSQGGHPDAPRRPQTPTKSPGALAPEAQGVRVKWASVGGVSRAAFPAPHANRDLVDSSIARGGREWSV